MWTFSAISRSHEASCYAILSVYVQNMRSYTYMPSVHITYISCCHGGIDLEERCNEVQRAQEDVNSIRQVAGRGDVQERCDGVEERLLETDAHCHSWFSSPVTSSLLGTNISLNTILEHFSQSSSLNMRDQGQHSYKTTDVIIILCIWNSISHNKQKWTTLTAWSS